ncbi:hypothetical protein [Streptomyces sp. NPDC046821]
MTRYLAAGQICTAIAGPRIAVTAVVVAWTDYSWFASAFDGSGRSR